jgi:hypothetical protein
MMNGLRRIFTGVVAVAATVALVQPASADVFSFSQASGFDFPADVDGNTSGTLRIGQTRNTTPNGLAIDTNGGLEFFNDGVLPASPAGTFHVLSWGCLVDGDTDNPPDMDSIASCANQPTANADNVVVGALVIPPSPTTVGRSYLRLATFAGINLDSDLGNEVRISRLEHLNRVIDNEANSLKAITILSELTITGADFTPAGQPGDTNTNEIALTFLETNNQPLDTVAPAQPQDQGIDASSGPEDCPGLNPLGSKCDDLFTFTGDFQDVPFTANGSTFFLQFRIGVGAECTEAANPNPFPPPNQTVTIYDCNVGTPQQHQIAVDFQNGRAWAPEGFDSSIEVFMKVTEEPVGDGGEGCTPGFWKQSQHFDSFGGGFQPNQTMTQAFLNFGGTPNFPNINESTITLVQALSTGGGGTNALLRHFIAAVLNAASPDVDAKYENITEIVAAVKAALAGQPANLGGEVFNSVESLKNALEASNQAGCPLN